MRSFSSEQIRSTFLSFFSQRGHQVVKSSPLVPHDDPTLLFTNAGMVQFKKVFLGQEKRPYTRAVSCQKCLRAGGKHNDLENVGRTLRHHTFFEMLGNFSFGDYFKREAIQMAWELLTEVFGLPESRLYVSVHQKDYEAALLWKEIASLSEDRIIPLGDEHNFWSMGDTGPCGPCSEIIYDQGEQMGCGRPDCGPSCDCDRFLELWNLVFMQYERTPEGELRPLPRPSIDTGMGLERMSAVLQGVKGNFDTDLFQGIIERIEELALSKYGEDPQKDLSIRVIADHARAVAFLIADGILPSNEGRGYVLRRILRRAVRHGYLLGIRRPFLVSVIEKVREKMSPIYPELEQGAPLIKEVVRREEERFFETLERGLLLLYEEIEELKAKGKRVLPGEVAFRLYDTYGFPLDLTEEIAREEGFEIDRENFDLLMEEQRQRGRASWKGELQGVFLDLGNLRTEFVGYETLSAKARVLAIIKGDKLIEEALPNEEVEVILDKTPFYPEGGGQVGDEGVLEGEGVFAEVKGALRKGDLLIHQVSLKEGILKRGQEVWAKVDPQKRQGSCRNHTATHLLHAALREILGEHARQAGSLVEPKRLRFDFTHFAPLDEETLEKIEENVNRRIMENHPVLIEILDLEEALRRGAIALFEEKYGEKVRLVEIPSISKELCGGTHVKMTGEIGLFKIVNETGIGSGIRRIEALTGEEALNYVKELEADFKDLLGLLNLEGRPSSKVTRELLKKRIQELLNLKKDLEAEIKALTKRLAEGKREDVEVKEIGGFKLAFSKFEGLDAQALREIGDQIKSKIGSGVVVLASEKDGRKTLLIMVTRDLQKVLPANQLLERVLKTIGGKGGGKEGFAQGTFSSSFEEAFHRVEEALKYFSFSSRS
jgi:alanyl-tRNA synthetase